MRPNGVPAWKGGGPVQRGRVGDPPPPGAPRGHPSHLHDSTRPSRLTAALGLKSNMETFGNTNRAAWLKLTQFSVQQPENETTQNNCLWQWQKMANKNVNWCHWMSYYPKHFLRVRRFFGGIRAKILLFETPAPSFSSGSQISCLLNFLSHTTSHSRVVFGITSLYWADALAVGWRMERRFELHWITAAGFVHCKKKHWPKLKVQPE